MARTKQPANRSWGHKRSSTSNAKVSTATSTPGKSPRKKAEGAGVRQKPHRFRPGTQALREIRRLQKSVDLLIPAAPFIRTVREITTLMSNEVTRWQAEALRALQEAAEDYIIQIFEDAMLCPIHAKRVTVTSSDFLSLKEVKQGKQFNLICKVLHISEVTEGEWMLFVWDGTDAPPVDVHTKLEEEFENPIPLQLEASPLSRDILCTFPSVGTVLRITAGNCNGKMGLPILKAGTWVQFRNISFEIRFGLWCGILMPKTRLSNLPDDDNLVLQCQRAYDERVQNKWGRMPLSCFPWPSYVTDTDYQNVPFVTLMRVLSHREVTAKFKCVVRVLTTLPGHPRDFRAPCGTYRLRVTLEDPTARLHAYLYAEDGVKFFGGDTVPTDTMIKMHNALLGVEEETDQAISNEKPRNPPWVQCCLKSYYIDKNDIWGSRRFRIFGTTVIS